MKTIDEYLKEGLTIEHYELIKKYKDSYKWERCALNVHDALKKSTMWSNTSEGHDFWSEIYFKLMEGFYKKYSNNIFLKL